MRLAVSKGCDVHARDEVFYYLMYVLAVLYCVSCLQFGTTALYYAIIYGYRKIASYLIIECGANVNDRDKVN